MSAFMCTPLHVACLIRYAAENGDLPGEYAGDLSAAANVLHAENARSVNHRYPDHEPEAAHTFTGREIADAPRLTHIQAVKAAHCLAYQSCEHPQWRASKAKTLLDRIEYGAATRVDGYDEAPWGIDSPADLRGVKS